MNIVVGVDGNQNHGMAPLAISLLCRLRFSKAQFDVVHVLTPELYEDLGVEIGNPISSFWDEKRAARESTQATINRVASKLAEGISAGGTPVAPCKVRPLVTEAPSIVQGLVRQADAANADLIAVDGLHVEAIGEFLTGSVARSLVIDSHHHSLLLAKDYQLDSEIHQSPIPKEMIVAAGDSSPKASAGARSDSEHALASVSTVSTQDRPIRAVFATDHSPHANRCLDALVRLAPEGISHLTVLGVYPEMGHIYKERPLPNPKDEGVQDIREPLMAGNDADIRKLSFLLESSGATSESRVLGGSVSDAIARTMEQTRSDLLIVGASSQGFMEHLLQASLSFHEAMAGQYSLLILRVSEEVARKDGAQGDSPSCQNEC